MDTKKVETVKPEVKDEKKLSPKELKNTKGGYGFVIDSRTQDGVAGEDSGRGIGGG